MPNKEIMDVFDAVAVVQEYTKPAFKELVALKDSVGRYSSADIYAPSDYPLWRRSKMDGFACNSAISDFSKPFMICGDISAADTYDDVLKSNECVRIATGAKVPFSADTIIKIEDSNESGDKVFLNVYLSDQNNIEQAGASVKSNQLLLAEGSRIDHRHIEILATLRINSVYVRGVPRIGILSTGSEITDKFASSMPVVNSNYYALSSLLNLYGVPHSSMGVCEDEKQLLKDTISSGIDNFDAFISCGGTALSRYDLMKTVVSELGGEIIIDGLNSSPGKTFRFGIVRGKPFFVLPGTPNAAVVCAELFVTTWLNATFGLKTNFAESSASFPVKKRSGFYKLSACFTKIEGGKLISYERDMPFDYSNAFRSIVIIPKNIEDSPAGEVYKTFLVYYM